MILPLLGTIAAAVVAAAETPGVPPPPAVSEPAAGTAPHSPSPRELTTYQEQASYALGQDMAPIMKRMQRELAIEFDLELVLRGMRDGLTDTKPLLTPEEIAAVKEENAAKVKAFREAEQKKREEELKVLGEHNKAEGEAYLADNATKPGVIVTDSGLQYLVLTEGVGASPTLFDRVKVTYRGTFIDGTEFDSSQRRGGPSVFFMTKLIAGWQQALKLMKEGGRWRLFIPPDLAYGERGKPPKIGPNVTLIFDIELLEVQGTAPEEGTSRPKR